MAQRRAPEEGYDFGNKRQYRRNIWNTFRLFCGGGASVARAMLMPSIEGAEIDVAVDKGFRRENLWAVDDNPAIVAHLTRRYGGINTCGVTVAHAAKRLASRGVSLDVANLDLCSQISGSQQSQLRGFADSGVMEYGLVSVTMLRGREHSAASEMIDCFSKHSYTCPVFHLRPEEILFDVKESGICDDEASRDRGRIFISAAVLAGALDENAKVRCESAWLSPRAVYLSRWGRYKSNAGNQTMLWAIYKVHQRPCVCDLCLATLAQALCDQHGKDKVKKDDLLKVLSKWWKVPVSDLWPATMKRIIKSPHYRIKAEGSRSRFAMDSIQRAEHFRECYLQVKASPRAISYS